MLGMLLLNKNNSVRGANMAVLPGGLRPSPAEQDSSEINCLGVAHHHSESHKLPGTRTSDLFLRVRPLTKLVMSSEWSGHYAADSPTAATDAVTPSPCTGEFDGKVCEVNGSTALAAGLRQTKPGKPVLSRAGIRRRGEARPLVALGDIRREQEWLTFLHVVPRER